MSEQNIPQTPGQLMELMHECCEKLRVIDEFAPNIDDMETLYHLCRIALVALQSAEDIYSTVVGSDRDMMRYCVDISLRKVLDDALPHIYS